MDNQNEGIFGLPKYFKSGLKCLKSNLFSILVFNKRFVYSCKAIVNFNLATFSSLHDELRCSHHVQQPIDF